MGLEARSTCLLLFMGAAGSGKSTLARLVLERVPMAYLNKDSVWEPLLACAESGAEYLAVRHSWYEALYRVAEDNLTSGVSVLLDAPHVRQVQDTVWVDWIRGLARRTSSRLLCVYCHCGESTLRRRLVQRGLSRDNWKLANWDLFLEQEPIRVAIPFSHVMVDTDRPPAEGLEVVMEYLDRGEEAR